MVKNSIKKRLLAFMLVLAVVFANGVSIVSADGATLVGDGTEENPYVISSAEQLAALGDLDEVGYAELAADIDMSEQDALPHIIKKLTGRFDGKGHTVSGLKLVGSEGEKWGDKVNTGFVSVLAGNICNLKLENISVATESQNNYVGTLAGQIETGNCTIENCIVTGSVTSTTEEKYPSADYIAGVVGYVFGYYNNPTVFTVKNCAFDVDVTASKKDYVAGIAASVGAVNVTVSNCAVFGDIKADSSEGYAGGLIGLTNSSSTVNIDNSYFAGTVSGSGANSAQSLVYMTSRGKNAGTLNYGENCFYLAGGEKPNPEAGIKTTITGSAEEKTEGELKALEIDGFEIRGGEFDGYPVPKWTPAAPPVPPEPSFSCTVKFEGTEDGTVKLFKDDTELTAENGGYALTEKGEYAYTVTDLADYEDVSDSFTVGDGDNETTKTVWVHLTYKTVELSGEGTEESPFIISKASELCSLAKKVNSGESSDCFVKLEQDITVNGSWTPLGKNAASPFRGTFDGDGHTVTVTVDNPAMSYFGFFGCLDDATVKNLTVGGEIYCSEPYAFVGGVAARARGNVNIENCVNTATVSAYARGNAGIGGIVGGYDDNIEYKWENIRLAINSCENRGLIVVTGADSNVFVGGIVGSTPNCVQLTDCKNTGAISAPGTWVGGLLGQSGSQMGDCIPLISDCESNGILVGAKGKTNRLYGKGTVAAKNITNSGDNTYSGGSNIENVLLSESEKYSDVISAPSNAAVGDSLVLLKDGMTADSSITFECKKGEKDITHGYIECSGGEIKLAKLNETGKAAVETLTLRFADSDQNALRKPVTVNIYPSESGNVSARRSLMERIAASYAGKSGDWVVFDMAAYERLGFGTNTTDKDNYLNLTVNELAGSSALASDRAKAEIIFAALGTDSTNLTPYGSEKSYNNAEKLANMNLGKSYYTAPWVLLAEEAGKTELSDEQRGSMISLLTAAQGENGLFQSIWGGEKYDDADTTATAIAALMRFYNDNEDVKNFVDKAVAGLSAAQRSDGSFGNVNTDAMVIIGLAAMGIDPASDARFVKNGCSLADALMLYVNDGNNGFTAGYISGDAEEKAQALATEQGFRALIVLEQLEKLGTGASFNIYTMKNAEGTEVIPALPSNAFAANGEGEVELPSNVTAPSGGSGSKNISAVVKVISDDESEWLSTSVTMPNGATAADTLKKAFADAGISAKGIDDGYIRSVTKGNVTLGQVDKGENSGWLYKVNGKTPSVGIADYKLKSGDAVTLYYTNDWTKESGTGSWSGGGGGGTGSAAKYTVKFETNGAAAIDSVTVVSGIAATAPTAPVKEGFTFGGWYTDKELTKPYAFTEKVSANITLYAKWIENQSSSDVKEFSDVNSGAWYSDAVIYAVGCGLMRGVSDTEFAPEDNVTRAMFVTILYRLKGSPTAGSAAFSDVATGEWYSDAVAWASENGIVSGVSETEFAPDENITREQLAAMMLRYAAAEGLDVSVGESTNILSYADFAAISEYAVSAIQYAVGSGLINGRSETTLAPQDNATRAETAAIMMRFAKMAE